MSAPERRLCAPELKVPCVMMHMAGLRQEQWGRRTLLRALGLWHPSADAVVPEAWASARAHARRCATSRYSVCACVTAHVAARAHTQTRACVSVRTHNRTTNRVKHPHHHHRRQHQ